MKGLVGREMDLGGRGDVLGMNLLVDVGEKVLNFLGELHRMK